MNVVKTILEHYPTWTINDVLNTDIKYLHKIMFNQGKKKKKKEIKPLSDLVKGGA